MPFLPPIPALVLITVFGLVFGSFLNVCIARLPRHESLVRPGSRCPHCHQSIRPWQNIPLLSFLLLRGRCAGCQRSIAWRYPLIEALTALFFVLAALRFGANIDGYGAMVFCFLLLGLAVMDLETLTLPDRFTLPGILLGLLWQALLPAPTWLLRAEQAGWAALWGLIFAGFLWFARSLYFLLRQREGLGLGDVKLMAMIAIWLGLAQAAEALFVGILAAALFGLAVLLRQKRSGLRVQLPLGFFLCAAALWTLLDGAPLLKWYLSFYR